MFGRYVDNLMEEAGASQDKPAQRNAARQRALQAALGIHQGGVAKAAPGQFRDPAEMVN